METNPSRNSLLRLIQPMSKGERALGLLLCTSCIGRKDRPCLKKLKHGSAHDLDKNRQSLSERGPRRTLQPFRGPHEQVFVRGVEVGGGESKDLLLFLQLLVLFFE